MMNALSVELDSKLRHLQIATPVTAPAAPSANPALPLQRTQEANDMFPPLPASQQQNQLMTQLEGLMGMLRNTQFPQTY